MYFVPEAFPLALASARYVPKSGTLAIVSNQVKVGICATFKAFALSVASLILAAAAATYSPQSFEYFGRLEEKLGVPQQRRMVSGKSVELRVIQDDGHITKAWANLEASVRVIFGRGCADRRRRRGGGTSTSVTTYWSVHDLIRNVIQLRGEHTCTGSRSRC
jgi:hypothetical protein